MSIGLKGMHGLIVMHHLVDDVPGDACATDFRCLAQTSSPLHICPPTTVGSPSMTTSTCPT